MAGQRKAAATHVTTALFRHHSGAREARARNDDADTVSHSRGMNCPSSALNSTPLQIEGAGKTGCWLHPWVPCNKKHGSRTTGSTGATRPSLRDGFTAYTWSPRCPGFLATVACQPSSASLIPASGDRDYTISPSASAALVSRHPCVHRIPPPTFVTIGRSAPPEGAGWRRGKHIFRKIGRLIFMKSRILRRRPVPDLRDSFSLAMMRDPRPPPAASSAVAAPPR